MRPWRLLAPVLLFLPMAGCSWAHKQIGYVMNGEAMSEEKPVPGLTEAKAAERIASLLKDSLQQMPDGFFFASYGQGDQPGQGGFGGGTSVPVFGDDAPNQIYSFSVSYWVHYPAGSLSVEDWFDKLAAYWSAHAQPVKAKKVYPRDESFATQDGYNIGLVINDNHDFALSCSSPYYGHDGVNASDGMPESITKNGYSETGEPPK